jgi:hypothetical protein
VNRERWFEIAETLSSVSNMQLTNETLCSSCQRFLSVTGVSISLVTKTNMTSLCASGEQAAVLEDAQFSLGEGPAWEAFLLGEPVLEEQLSSGSLVRWPALSTLARDAGIEGIFSFPLQIGAARSGVLTLYQRDAGAWSPAQHGDALIAADALIHVILSVQSKEPAGSLARALRDAGSYRAEVHQASGMLSAQSGVSVAEALVLLRGRAYATDQPIALLARAVIARRLRLERSGSLVVDWSEG